MSRTHSAGPWTIGAGFTVECPSDIPGMPGRVAQFGFRPNAVRTVACVNACDGIDDPGAALAQARDLLAGLRETLDDPQDYEAAIMHAYEVVTIVKHLLGGSR